MRYLILIISMTLIGCVTANRTYKDNSGIDHSKWTGITHPDTNY